MQPLEPHEAFCSGCLAGWGQPNESGFVPAAAADPADASCFRRWMAPSQCSAPATAPRSPPSTTSGTPRRQAGVKPARNPALQRQLNFPRPESRFAESLGRACPLVAPPVLTCNASMAPGTVFLQAGGWDLRPTAVLLPPHPSTAAAGLPSMELPSDHIPLLARFQVAAAHPVAAAAHPGAEAGPGCSVGTDASGNGAAERTGRRTAVHEAAAAAAAEARVATGGAAAARAGTMARATPGGAAGNGSRQPNGGGTSCVGGSAAGEGQSNHAPQFVGIGTVL